MFGNGNKYLSISKKYLPQGKKKILVAHVGR
jgi:hypothetical protein